MTYCLENLPSAPVAVEGRDHGADAAPPQLTHNGWFST